MLVGNSVGHAVKMLPRLVGERNVDHYGFETEMTWSTPAFRRRKGNATMRVSCFDVTLYYRNCNGSCARQHSAARGCTQGCPGAAQAWTRLHTTARGRARLHQDCTILHRVARLRKAARMWRKVTTGCPGASRCPYAALLTSRRSL